MRPNAGDAPTPKRASAGVLRFLGEDDVMLRKPEILIDLADHLVKRSLG
jgi:hypothetical protein